jgi:hypothetical protein
MKTFHRRLAVWLALAISLLLAAANPAAMVVARPSAEAGQSSAYAGPLLYQFTGARDDGAKSVSGKAATTLNCSNTGTTLAAASYYVFNFTGSIYYYVDFTIPAKYTYTISTQYTAMYSEDVVLRAAGTADSGTGVIDQGLGQVYSNSRNVICTAQVLDPTGYPPTFVTRLTMHDANCRVVRTLLHNFVPVISH